MTLRSVELQHPDLSLAEKFFCGPWGLRRAAAAERALYLSACGPDHHCIALKEGPGPTVLSSTFRVESKDDLASLMTQVQSAGAKIESTLRESDDPAGGWMCAIIDPQGRRFRFVADDRQYPERRPQPDQPIGLTHVNLNTSNMEEATSFFVQGLGMVLTDRTDHHNFLRCNSDHHSVVLANTRTNTINHIAFLMPDLESVMRRSGILRDHGHEIGWGVGRHGPGNNVFSYFESPLGFVVEVTTEVLQVDDSYRVKGPQDWAWPPGRTDHWGVTRPPSATLRAAQLAVPYGAAV